MRCVMGQKHFPSLCLSFLVDTTSVIIMCHSGTFRGLSELLDVNFSTHNNKSFCNNGGYFDEQSHPNDKKQKN